MRKRRAVKRDVLPDPIYKSKEMAVRPMGPRRHWVVLGSFTPRPLLWDSELSSIRVKRFLLNSNF